MKPTRRQKSSVLSITLFAATLLCLTLPASAATLEEYTAKIERARVLIGEIETSLGNEDSDRSYLLSRVENIRSDFSRPERVDWQGGSVEVPTAWLLDRLKSFETETDPKRGLKMIIEVREYITALSFKLNELKESTTTASRTKDEDKQKLAEILRREEYQKPQAQGESLIQRWIAAIIEFLESLLPKPKGPSAGTAGLGAFGLILQLLLWGGLFALLAFLIYKIAPMLFPGLGRAKAPRKKNRVILGEKIEEDETALDLLAEAERLAREGNLRGAIRKGYIALLCDLSDRKIIGLARNKTNRDYVRDVRSRQDLHPRMKSVTDTFERHWYGAQKSEEHDWIRFREEYEAAMRSVLAMKQKILILLVLIFLIGLLAALNAASYVQKEKIPDTEFAPNRSTFNSGSTGTQAFYALLLETSRKVTRWQTSLETIATDLPNQPSVFVMIGPARRALTDTEKTQLMKWVANGGTLILIDREPSSELATTTANWHITVAPKNETDLYTVDASDQKQMTANTPAQKPVLPSSFSHSVNAVQPSRFAASITLARLRDDLETTGSGSGIRVDPGSSPVPTPYDFYSDNSQTPPDADLGFDDEVEEEAVVENSPTFEAPIVHFGGADQNLLVEAPFEDGRVIVLSDPYIVSNAGINVVDNSRLAVNLVTSREGLIAFDEYHHGYGANNNRFFEYFEGTPVLAIFLQCGLLVAIVFFSQSRRFARPVPEPEASRLSKLEYVSAMAELQQRTRAYDLAIENIYTDFRRRVSALVGLDNTTASRKEIAVRIAERTGGDVKEIETLLYQCEDVVHGEPIERRETISLVERLRKIEDELGLKRSRRTGV